MLNILPKIKFFFVNFHGNMYATGNNYIYM